jgi:hypothetical protein
MIFVIAGDRQQMIAWATKRQKPLREVRYLYFPEDILTLSRGTRIYLVGEYQRSLIYRRFGREYLNRFYDVKIG